MPISIPAFPKEGEEAVFDADGVSRDMTKVQQYDDCGQDFPDKEQDECPDWQSLLPSISQLSDMRSDDAMLECSKEVVDTSGQENQKDHKG